MEQNDNFEGGAASSLPAAPPAAPLALRKPDILVPMSIGVPAPRVAASRREPEDAEHEIARRYQFSVEPEALLAGIIDECRFLMREVAYPSMIQAADPETRIAFMRSAMGLAETAASTARAVAKLRAVPMEESRKEAIALEAEGRIARGEQKKAESEKQ